MTYLKKKLLSLIVMTLLLPCCTAGEMSVEQKNMTTKSLIDFAPGPEDMEFVAAVRFHRIGVELIKAEGWEANDNLDAYPNII
jgi:hypothetical protein